MHPASPIDLPRRAVAKPARCRSARLVLVVARAETTRRQLARALAGEGFEVLTFAATEPAVAWLERHLPDTAGERAPALALSDSGPLAAAAPGELARAVARIPWIWLAPEASEAAYAEAFDRGAMHVLTRPFDATTLRLAVQNALEAPPPPREARGGIDARTSP
jgi:DNA-binding NtrC family response regulator